MNTAIIGSNGVLNRVAEDGVLPDWFRHPHRRFGTTSRLINLIVILQIVTIVISRGDVIMLGEAYAFGVIWSFAMKALAVLVLRYKRPEAREWKVPFNLRIGETEVPVGLILITATLFVLAFVNVLTKKTATISGSIFTVGFFTAFALSERHNHKKRQQNEAEQEKFRLEERPEVSVQDVHVRPRNILVEVNDPSHLEALKSVLQEVNSEKQDVVVVAVHKVGALGSSEYRLAAEQICSNREVELFSKVVTVAEKAGKHVELLTVAGKDESSALVAAAQSLRSARIVTSASANTTIDEQARLVGEAWECLPSPRPPLTLQVVQRGGADSQFFSLGPHPPRLWPTDIDLVHKLWQELSSREGVGGRLHHRDIIGIALRRLEVQLHSGEPLEVLADVDREMARANKVGSVSDGNGSSK